MTKMWVGFRLAQLLNHQLCSNPLAPQIGVPPNPLQITAEWRQIKQTFVLRGIIESWMGFRLEELLIP